MQFNNLKIADIVQETPDTKTIYFSIPDSLKDQYKFKAGQYLTLKAEINNEEVRRAYSICTPPHSDTIGATVKVVKNGKMSGFIHKNWKAGDSVSVGTPEGNFSVVAEANRRRALFFFTAGSGITPVMSMIQHILEEEPMSACHLLYGNRTEEDIIFKAQLDELCEKYSGQLSVHYVLSRPKKEKAGGFLGLFKKSTYDWQGSIGRIDRNLITKLIEEHPVRGAEASYFLCGPGDMIDTSTLILKSLNVDEKNIHREFFSTQVKAENQKKGTAAEVIVTLEGQDFTVSMAGDKPILDELVAAGKNPPYSCTSGACSTCMAKVVEGSAVMDVCYALDDSEVKAGYILTCQAKPTSEKLKITFDV